jgi:hypothetical protein
MSSDNNNPPKDSDLNTACISGNVDSVIELIAKGAIQDDQNGVEALNKSIQKLFENESNKNLSEVESNKNLSEVIALLIRNNTDAFSLLDKSTQNYILNKSEITSFIAAEEENDRVDAYRIEKQKEADRLAAEKVAAAEQISTNTKQNSGGDGVSIPSSQAAGTTSGTAAGGVANAAQEEADVAQNGAVRLTAEAEAAAKAKAEEADRLAAEKAQTPVSPAVTPTVVTASSAATEVVDPQLIAQLQQWHKYTTTGDKKVESSSSIFEPKELRADIVNKLEEQNKNRKKLDAKDKTDGIPIDYLGFPKGETIDKQQSFELIKDQVKLDIAFDKKGKVYLSEKSLEDIRNKGITCSIKIERDGKPEYLEFHDGKLEIVDQGWGKEQSSLVGGKWVLDDRTKIQEDRLVASQEESQHNGLEYFRYKKDNLVKEKDKRQKEISILEAKEKDSLESEKKDISKKLELLEIERDSLKEAKKIYEQKKEELNNKKLELATEKVEITKTMKIAASKVKFVKNDDELMIEKQKFEGGPKLNRVLHSITKAVRGKRKAYDEKERSIGDHNKKVAAYRKAEQELENEGKNLENKDKQLNKSLGNIKIISETRYDPKLAKEKEVLADIQKREQRALFDIAVLNQLEDRINDYKNKQNNSIAIQGEDVQNVAKPSQDAINEYTKDPHKGDEKYKEYISLDDGEKGAFVVEFASKLAIEKREKVRDSNEQQVKMSKEAQIAHNIMNSKASNVVGSKEFLLEEVRRVTLVNTSTGRGGSPLPVSRGL